MASLGLTPEHELQYEKYLDRINRALSDYLEPDDSAVAQTAAAMKYSTMIGGKRIRPVLVLEFCRLCGGDWEDALPMACAIEMIHTSSLIHDDLPCMDNDDYRRGKPSCHKEYGENYALLAGDALEAYAFEVASHAEVDSEAAVKCIQLLSRATGIRGMLGGQTMDEENEGKPELSLDRVTETNARKTGALIRAACEMGCAVAGADPGLTENAVLYGEDLGLAFQIQDDILDVVGDAATLGKATGHDAEGNKTTYVGLLGLEESRRRAADFTDEALSALEHFPDHAFLADLTRKLLTRNY